MVSQPGLTARQGGTAALRAAALIPARLASTRLERKMLLEETGQALCVHTARNVLESGLFRRVVVASDSPEVAAVVRAAGLDHVPTSKDHESGTARIAEAARALALDERDLEVVVNVQGDEPELAHASLARLLEAFAAPEVELATLAAPLGAREEFISPHVVKVVCDLRGDALYFSRAPIPHRRDERGRADARPLGLRHVGVYAFRPRALQWCAALPSTELESSEGLEQLRWLAAGAKLRVVEVEQISLGIDTRADYDAFVRRASARRR